MPILSRARRYLFLMAPRTGCTAIGEGVLTPHLDGEYFPSTDVLDDSGNLVLDHKHASLGELIDHSLLAREEAARLFKFTTVRNPFDSLVTLYVTMRTKYKDLLEDPNSFVHRRPGMQKRIRRAEEHPFDEWLEHRFHVRGLKGGMRYALRLHPRPRHMYHAYIEGADFVMRFERLEDDFNEAQRRLGVSKPIEIPHLNITEGREPDYRSYYSARSRRIVERAFTPDFERFEYCF
jgi:hypothetical protein